MLNEMAGLGSQWQIKGEFLVSELDYLLSILFPSLILFTKHYLYHDRGIYTVQQQELTHSP